MDLSVLVEACDWLGCVYVCSVLTVMRERKHRWKTSIQWRTDRLPTRVPRHRVLCVISLALNPITSASYTGSHTRAVMLLLPGVWEVASRRPSGLKHTEFTTSPCSPLERLELTLDG